MVQRVAIYARVSTSDQSCQRQLAELAAYAARGEFEVVGTFPEVGIGGKNDRVERKKIIALARKKLIDIVLVTELSRWGRSTSDLRATVEDLAARGVALRALNGPDFDISTAQGKLMLNLLSAISEFERDLLRERINSGIAHARAKGTKSGQAIGRPIFNHPERVDHLLTEGKSVRNVADELGISKSTVMKVKTIMNKTITGTCKLCGSVGEIKNSHIVPNFILKMLKDDRKNQYALLPSLLTAESPSEPVQQGMREYLLCEKCENKFSKWENRFSVHYKQVLTKEVSFPTDYFKQDWLLLLALSFAWRAGQSFLLKASGVIPDAELAIVRKACDFWSQFLLDENLPYTGARPIWWETRYETVLASNETALQEIATQPDGLDSYLARFCDYAIGPSADGLFLWFKVPFLVMTIAVEPQTPGLKLTADQYREVLYTRVAVTKNHIDQNTTDEQRQERTDAILKRTSQQQRDAFYATRFGESAILDKQRSGLKAQ